MANEDMMRKKLDHVIYRTTNLGKCFYWEKLFSAIVTSKRQDENMFSRIGISLMIEIT